jgi:hypothetical protein
MCFDHETRPPALPDERVLPAVAGGAGAEVLTVTAADGSEFSAALAGSPSADGQVDRLPSVRGPRHLHALHSAR